MDRIDLREDLTRRIRNLLQEEAFDLWDLEVAFQSGRGVIRIFLDRAPGVTLDDCAYWNKKIGRYLEAEDVFRGRYVLEVGSPGLDRTLVKPEHFARFLGANVEMKLHDPREGRRAFHGEILAAGADTVVIADPEAGTVSLPYASIRKARLVVDPWEGMRGQERRRKG